MEKMLKRFGKKFNYGEQGFTLIELLIVIDLVMLIVLATVLAFGIDSSIDEFHTKLNSFTLWFKE